MKRSFDDNDFDILAFAEHGIVGKEWDQEPTRIPLFYFQLLWHGKRSHPTTEMYHAVLDGTYKTAKGLRTKKRGLQCVPDTIETNMFTLMKNPVNGYFTNVYEGKYGKENDFEIPISLVEESGGISHINHPSDWLGAYKDPDCAKMPENVAFFADLFRRYKSCVGMEVLNMYDRPNRSDRILWDELLKVLIPEGERCVWGFGNTINGFSTYGGLKAIIPSIHMIKANVQTELAPIVGDEAQANDLMRFIKENGKDGMDTFSIMYLR